MTGTPAVSPKQFIAGLEREVAAQGLDLRTHPFSFAVQEGRASMEGLRLFTRHHGLLSARAPKRMLVKLFYCEDPVLLRDLAGNVYEELTGGLSRTAGHVDLIARFAAAIGLDMQDCVAPRAPTPLQAEILAEGNGWREMTADEVLLSSSHIRAGGEPASAITFARIAEGLRKHYGLAEQDIEFFSMHTEVDKDHGDFAVQCMERYATTPERQQQAREYVYRSLRRMIRVYDSGMIGAR